MHKLIQFIRSIYVVVLFVVLEAVAVSHYAHSTYYTRAQLLARATQVVGSGEDLFSRIQHYFRLERENRELIAYTALLQERLAEYEAAGRRDAPLPGEAEAADTNPAADSLAGPGLRDIRSWLGERHYRTLTAAVVSNSINKAENFLVLNRGTQDSVRKEMAVLSAGGAIVGHVVDCTEHYAVVLSVLSRSFRTSGRLGDTNYFGQIYWDGSDPHTVLLGDLTKYAEPQPGQEVETTGSLFFPDGLRIGRIVDAQLDESGLTYTARVELAARMTGLSHVILVENRDLEEIRTLLGSDQLKQYQP